MSDYLLTAKKAKAKTALKSFKSGIDFFTDEATASLATAKDCYNFDFSSGALTEGYGIFDFGLFQGLSLSAIWLYKRYDQSLNERDDRILGVSVDGKLYQSRDDMVTRVGSVVFTQVPSFINYRLNGEDVVFICSASDGMFVYDGKSEPYKVDSAPNITSMVLHGERLFVTVAGERNAVWFSDDLDPTNWDASLTGGGFIQMMDERGALNKVISYLNYVYVFRSYGISRISALGSQSDFSVSNLFVAGGKIYPDTVALCGDTVVFLAEDGLYAFDGLSARRLLKNLDGLVENGESAIGSYASGKYYLAFRRETDGDKVGVESGEYENNALLVVELSSGRYALSRGMDIRNFCFLGDYGMTAVTNDGRNGKVDKCGSLYGVALKKRWKIPKTDMGVVEKKLIKELYLFTEYPCSVTLVGDEKRKTILFDGKNTVQRKRLTFASRRLGVEIESSAVKAGISRPTLTTVKGGF